MRKMYNRFVSMFVKGWGKLFGEGRLNGIRIS